MAIDLYRSSMLGQFEASLWMLRDCIQKCPASHWAGPGSIIGKYEFWHVVHHTLSCTDTYLSKGEDDFQPRPEFHPAGKSDLEDEYPSRQFSKDEMLKYVEVCLAKLRAALTTETEESLREPGGFSWQKQLTRADIYPYSMRHVMHHGGQLSAFLRRIKPALPLEQQPKWRSKGCQ